MSFLGSAGPPHPPRAPPEPPNMVQGGQNWPKCICSSPLLIINDKKMTFGGKNILTYFFTRSAPSVEVRQIYAFHNIKKELYQLHTRKLVEMCIELSFYVLTAGFSSLVTMQQLHPKTWEKFQLGSNSPFPVEILSSSDETRRCDWAEVPQSTQKYHKASKSISK